MSFMGTFKYNYIMIDGKFYRLSHVLIRESDDESPYMVYVNIC